MIQVVQTGVAILHHLDRQLAWLSPGGASLARGATAPAAPTCSCRPGTSIAPKGDVADAGPGTHVMYSAALWTKTCRDCGTFIPDGRICCNQCRDKARAATQQTSSYLHYHDTHPNSQANRDAHDKGFRDVRDMMEREGRVHKRSA
jgi:hypothetical protein